MNTRNTAQSNGVLTPPPYSVMVVSAGGAVSTGATVSPRGPPANPCHWCPAASVNEVSSHASKHRSNQRLIEVQELMAQGDEGTVKICETTGVNPGHTIPHCGDFYAYAHMLILGRVTTGEGGDIVLLKARNVLKQEFPETARATAVHVPDEKTRRARR